MKKTIAYYEQDTCDLRASSILTLQGGVAHCGMPLQSGPTQLLLFSQSYRPGYVSWRRDDLRALFEERYVQLSLAKGDAVFFNPALFHAASVNTNTDIHRFANMHDCCLLSRRLLYLGEKVPI